MTVIKPNRAILLFFLCMQTYGYFSTIINPNVQSRVALSLSLVEQSSVNINQLEHFTEDKAFANGNYYSDKAPGLSLLAAPLAYVMSCILDPKHDGSAWIHDGSLSPRYGIAVYIMTLLTVGSLAAGAVVATYRWNMNHGMSQHAALFAALTLGLATPVFGWATMFFGHVASGALLLFGFMALTDAYAKRSSWMAGLSGLLMGASFITEFTAGPAVAIIGLSVTMLALLASDRWHVVLAVLVPATIGLLIAIAPLAAYNKIAFHSPYHIGYENVRGFSGMKQGMLGVRLPEINVIWEILFGAYRGVLPLAPVLILCPFAICLGMQDRRTRLTAIVATLIIVYYVCMNSGYYYWNGGYSTGPRHILPAIGFATLLFGCVWDRSGSLARRAYLVLLVVSIVISLICASVNMVVSPDLSDPFIGYLLPEFLKGDLHRMVIGRLVPHVGGLFALLPLLLAWIFGCLMLLRGEGGGALPHRGCA